MAKTKAAPKDRRQQLLDGQEFEQPADESVDATEDITPDGDDDAVEQEVDDAVDEDLTRAEQEPESTEPEAETPASIAEAVRGLGFEGIEQDDQAIERLITGYRQMKSEYDTQREALAQLETMARVGQYYLSQQKQQEGKAAAHQPEKDDASEQPAYWWAPPQFDPTTVERFREFKPDGAGGGEWTWKTETPAEVRLNAERYAQYIDDWGDALVRKPHEVLPPIIRQEVEGFIDEIFDQRFGSRIREQQLAEFAREISSQNKWLHERDARTNQPLYSADGRPVLSQEGKRVMQLLDHVESTGVSDPREQWRFALALYHASQAEQVQASNGHAEQARTTAAEKRRKHVRQGMQNRGGSITPSETPQDQPQNRHQSRGWQLVTQMRTDGALTGEDA